MALTWMLTTVFLFILLIVGFVLPLIKERRVSRLIAWMIAISTAVFSTLISADETPLVRMLVIVVLQLVSMKIVVAVETYAGKNELSPVQWAAFCLGWFGMRPAPFKKLPQHALPFRHILLKAMSRVIIGFFLLYLSAELERHSELKAIFVPQLLLLVGLSFILHFGLLNLSTATWRMSGVNVPELFQSPYKSRSLREFWGKRWNIAFSEMTALIAYRPLKTTIGVEKALIVSFLLSGLLHEIAISFPVKTGFGLPMIYFVIHALAIHLEGHSIMIQKIINHRWMSHVWVMLLLVLPMPLLFHPSFIHQVLVPLRTLLLQPLGMS